MKLFFFVLATLWWPRVHAQPTIELSTELTTSVQFHQPIRHVDVGSGAVLVQPIAGVDSILLLKAGAVDFTSTNLTVITRDGALHSFRLRYAAMPAQWVYSIGSASLFSPERIAESLLLRERWMHGIRQRRGDVRLQVEGIYVRDAAVYLVLGLRNATAFPYAPDGLRVYVRDRHVAKRVAQQETLLTPQALIGDTTLVPPFGEGRWVLVLDRLTLAPHQVLAIELSERNGGRHFLLRIRPNQLLHAKLP